MTSQNSIFHAYLRPSILQILRATGYYSTRPVVLDSLTDLAAKYLQVLCEKTASNAINNHGDAADYSVVDIRLALQEAGALAPERLATEQDWIGEEDTRGVDEFLEWFSGQRMKELMEIGSGDGEADATDYLNALKKKHSKTGDDAKYHGTSLGRNNDYTGDILVEGGTITSISEWVSQRSPPPGPRENGVKAADEEDPDSRPPSSGLSSVGDRLDEDGEEAMDLS